MSITDSSRASTPAQGPSTTPLPTFSRRLKIYAKRLSWFKQMEAEDASGRLDRHEGVVAWHQPDRITNLVINGWNLTPDLAGPVEMHCDWLNYLNIYCTYAGRILDVEPERIPHEIPHELKSQLAIPERCLSLGRYAVVIKYGPEFIRRVGEAAKNRRCRMWHGRVNYYNPDIYHGHHFNVEAAFWKQDRYSYQSEFRFAIDTQTEGAEPVILEIGNIRDITLAFQTSELNNKLLGI